MDNANSISNYLHGLLQSNMIKNFDFMILTTTLLTSGVLNPTQWTKQLQWSWLTCLLPLQWYSQQKQHARAPAMPQLTVQCIITCCARGDRRECVPSPQPHRQITFSWLNFQSQLPNNLFATSNKEHGPRAEDTAAAKATQICQAVILFYT